MKHLKSVSKPAKANVVEDILGKFQDALESITGVFKGDDD